MLKISTKKSVMLSIVLSVAFFAIIIFCAIIMPRLVNMLVGMVYTADGAKTITDTGYTVVLVLSYMALVIMGMADVMLFNLLLRVRNGEVFTAKSVGLIRGVSWCAILLGMVFAVLVYYFRISFLISFACVFLGICVRVVKNVIEQATEIKSEHDFTI